MKMIRNSSMALCGLLIGAIVLFAACKKDDNNTNNGKNYTVSGSASGANMVPSVSGTGTGTISGTYNSGTKVLNYNTSWNGLTGAPVSGGFYTGASGANGTAVGGAWAFPGTPTATGNISGTMTLTTEQETQLLAGNWYYTLGTTANAGGEVRGQISTTPQ